MLKQVGIILLSVKQAVFLRRSINSVRAALGAQTKKVLIASRKTLQKYIARRIDIKLDERSGTCQN